MLSDQRLSVTFGAFSCEVVGYDDPFAILTRVVELFGEIAKSNPAFGAGEVPMSDMERARLAAGLADQASRIDELADQSAPNGMRYVVSNAGADAPDVNNDAPDETVAEDEVVIAAQADETEFGGDLELRDTLEAIGSPEPRHEEEVVALDIAATTPATAPTLVADEPLAKAPLELTQPVETPVIVEAPSDDEEAHTAAAVAAAPMSDEPEDLETVAAEAALEEIDTADLEIAELHAAETAMEDDAADEPEPTDTPIASLVEAKADKRPARQPLRLNLSGQGVEPKTDDAPPKAPEAKEAEAASEKPQRRVTITKLPLRPERSSQAEQPEQPEQVEQVKTSLKHSLSPVQKVAPVVTFSPTFGDSADEAPTQSRAERVRARMEQREAEDDGENFLFSDVNETPQNDAPTASETDDQQAADQSPLIFAPMAPEPSTPREEPAKKPRRSIASLLGFGKNRSSQPDPGQNAPAPSDHVRALAEDNYEGDADGFVRLHRSVAAAMPPADAPTVRYPAANLPPESISEAIDYNDETSPTAFARRVGATSLQDLLEASAVYMDVVEGKSRFSRRDVMQALNQIGSENDYTQEARLKSFRRLLTTGSLVRVDDGMFTVSQSTRFGYETRLQA